MRPPKSRPKDKDSPGVTLSVRIQPRASKNEATRLEDGSLKIRLTAPPVDGAANEALVKFLADRFSVAKSRVEIVSGHTSRDKIVRISGKSSADAESLLYKESK